MRSLLLLAPLRSPRDRAALLLAAASAEGDDGGSDGVSLSGRSVSVVEKGQARSFDNDVAYDSRGTNAQLYSEQVEPLVQRVIGGYNSTVIAYGAGRSGKTYTLFGGNNEDGIVDSAAESLFNRLESMSGSCKALVTLSVFDVYNAQIIDLLCPNSKAGLTLLEHRSQGAVIDGLAELVATNAKDASLLVKQAMAVHDALEARMTNQLGKPHTFIDVKVEVIEHDNPSTIRYATLRFVTPAGSGGVSLKFNQGLQALGKVVEALAAEKEPWNVPYASSRLTRLLETSLGGNALTLWITTLDSALRSAPDSLHALEMGDKLRRIKNVARVNKNTIVATIRELREEIKKARGKLQLTQPGTYMHDIDPAQLKILKQLISELERIKGHTWEKKQQRSSASHEARRQALEQEGLLYTLADSRDVDIPEQLLSSSRTLLSAIVAARAALDDQEAELTEKRGLFKLRLDALQRKAAEASSASSSASSSSGAAVPSVAELTKSDEKLTKLDRAVTEIDERVRQGKSELQHLEDEYRKALTKIATIESKQRKLFLIGKDAAGLERLNKAQEWSTMKRDMESDRQLEQVIAMIASNTATQKQALQSSADPVALKEAALQTMDSLREATESVSGKLSTFCTQLSTLVFLALLLTLACATVVVLRAQSKRLEWERDALWGRLIESKFKHEVAMTRYQEHMFFVRRHTSTQKHGSAHTMQR